MIRKTDALGVEVEQRLLGFAEAFLEDAALVLRLLEQQLHLLDLSLVHLLDACRLLPHVLLQVRDLLLETLVLQLVEAALRNSEDTARERVQWKYRFDKQRTWKWEEVRRLVVSLLWSTRSK